MVYKVLYESRPARVAMQELHKALH
jgi:DNA-dependent RNA polymerase auxiliary subunit epsilon